MNLSLWLVLVLIVTLGWSLVPPRPSSCPPTSLCVDRCCPPGSLYLGQGVGCSDPEYEGEFPYNPETDLTFKPSEVSLLGKDNFECSEGEFLVSTENLIEPYKYVITSSGQLRVFINETFHEDFNYGDYCVAFSRRNQTSNQFQYDDHIKTTYSVCYSDSTVDVDDETVYPVAIFISDIFVFLTLAVYLSLSHLRNNTFGRITIGFLVNVFISFFCIGIHYSLNIRYNKNSILDTPGCTLLGYITQHTLVAVFFWMSAMSIYITRTMHNSFTESKVGSFKTIFLNSVYAQGSAFLVTMITLIMDSQADTGNYVLPNIGSHNCWLGSGEEDSKVSFTSTPEFLYFYLIIIFIIIINLICFLKTGFSLFSHWWQMRGLAQGSINELLKTQLTTLAKLYIIMGIPWFFDVISVWVKHNYGRSNTYEIRIALNILNLLQGLLIFVTLICKETVLTALKNRLFEVKYFQTRVTDSDTAI